MKIRRGSGVFLNSTRGIFYAAFPSSLLLEIFLSIEFSGIALESWNWE